MPTLPEMQVQMLVAKTCTKVCVQFYQNLSSKYRITYNSVVRKFFDNGSTTGESFMYRLEAKKRNLCN